MKRAKAADLTLLDEGETTCCYACSDKHWITDPQGIAWEHFPTLDNLPGFSEATPDAAAPAEASACCAAAAPCVKPIDVAVIAASPCC